MVNKVNNLYPKMVYKVLKNLKTNTVKLKSQKRLKEHIIRRENQMMERLFFRYVKFRDL